MKRVSVLLAAALLLAGCRGGESSGSTLPPEGITMHPTEDIADIYTDTVKAYFTALEQNDFDAYLALVHPVYKEAFGAYLTKKDSSLEKNFTAQRKRFDEDGYESWRITDITLSKHQNPDYDYFFRQFTEAGILTEEQVKAVKDSAEETEDVKFSVDALYQGDAEPVTVFYGQQMILFKTADGVRCFG